MKKTKGNNDELRGAAGWKREFSVRHISISKTLLYFILLPYSRPVSEDQCVCWCKALVLNSEEEEWECRILLCFIFIGQTSDPSLELRSLQLEEKLIALCPGNDVTEVLKKSPPETFEIHFLCNYYCWTCFLPFPWLNSRMCSFHSWQISKEKRRRGGFCSGRL